MGFRAREEREKQEREEITIVLNRIALLSFGYEPTIILLYYSTVIYYISSSPFLSPPQPTSFLSPTHFLLYPKTRMGFRVEKKYSTSKFAILSPQNPLHGFRGERTLLPCPLTHEMG